MKPSMTIAPFDLYHDALEGVSLIEAGAGTGKTYTLTGIALRLIVERGVAIDQILVVTYTKAATEELKTRIRYGLLQARAAYQSGVGQDGTVAALLLERMPDANTALHRIHAALTDFDRAAIFTIHGFCQRLLQQFAFETGVPFASELIQDSQPYIQAVVDDFWRRHVVCAPYEFVRYAHDTLKSPDHLAGVLTLCRYPDVRILEREPVSYDDAIQLWRRSARDVRSQWGRDRAAICRLLLDNGLYARPYGRCEPLAGDADRTHRDRFIDAIAARMDHWSGRYPLHKQVQALSQAFIDRHTKKGHTPIQHPFFDCCQVALSSQAEMEHQFARYVRQLKIELLKQAEPSIRKMKTRRNVLFFDDLLMLVHRAIHAKHGRRLINAVRKQYRAALVDEFQDTDPLQYDIFTALFAQSGHLLGLIGDPKQAIYSFRGADLFSYLKAAGQAASKKTLTKNWRSTPGLINAVNTLFENHLRPFGFAAIQYRKAVAASAGAGEPDRSPPFTVWYLTPDETAHHTRPISQQEAVARIAGAVATQIGELLTNADCGSYEPSQIAILTRTHFQSQIVKDALADKGIPAVLHGAGSVYHTRDAIGLYQLMRAVASPNDRDMVGALLSGDYYTLNAADCCDGDDGPSDRWRTCHAALTGDLMVWRRYGFFAMFRQWAGREQVKATLLAMPDGERRLTNLLHLAELVHQAEVDTRMAHDALLHWLAGRIHSTGGQTEDQQLRLESDAKAVRIITMHKSKGLQFDVVFCPFTWSGVRMNPDAVVFHDPDHADALTLSIGPDIDPAHQQHGRLESLSENLRMLYVAVTRARKRCYLVWGRINQSETSAPAYLIHGKHLVEGDETALVARLQETMNRLTNAQCIADLHQLAAQSGGAIAVAPLPETDPGRCALGRQAAGALRHRRRTRTLPAAWRVSSFSSLTAAADETEIEWPDHDILAESVTEGVRTTGFDDLIQFPKGAQAGLFFHDVLEHWDHTVIDPSAHLNLVRSTLAAHGFDQRWDHCIGQLLQRLSRVRLDALGHRFSLGRVASKDRINEMAFTFPLKRIGPADLRQALTHAGLSAPLDGLMSLSLERLDFTPVKGLMKGFIDAVIRHDGRYYLVDWKSNHLGNTTDDYHPQALGRVMVQDRYYLQYLLYAVALDQLLETKIEGYDYARCFGGVFYIFLRGLSDDPLSTAGIYFVKPDADIVRSLTDTLVER